nr:MAG TPA: IlvGEDA operon leader peptide [Caudoviricetes sp.]
MSHASLLFIFNLSFISVAVIVIPPFSIFVLLVFLVSDIIIPLF